MIQHHKLSLLERYVFCTAPIRFKLKLEETNSIGAQTNSTAPGNPTTRGVDKKNWLAMLMEGPKTQQHFFTQFVADYASLGEVPFHVDPKKLKAELKKRQTNHFAQIEILESVYWSSNRLISVCESYLWLNYKFPAEFFEIEKVKECQKSVVEIINRAISEQMNAGTTPKSPRKPSKAKDVK